MAVSTITEQSFTEAAKSQLRKLMYRQLDHMTQISSGQRVSEVSDDPEAIGRAIRFYSGKHKNAQYQKNAAQAEAVAETGFNSLNQMRTLLIRAQEIASQTNSELTSTQIFATYEAEVNQIIDSAVNSANAKHLKDYIFSGTKTDTRPFQETRDVNGQVISIGYQGNSDSAEFYISDTTKVTPYGKAQINGNIQSSVNYLIDLRDALAAKDPNAVQTAAINLIDIEAKVTDGTVDYGSVVKQVEIAQFQNDYFSREADKQISKDLSADIAGIMVEFSRDKLAYEAAVRVNSVILQRSSLLNYL